MEHALRKTVALADAEISPSEIPGLIQELARSPSLVRALQMYVATGRQRVAKVYEAKRDEPVPQWLVDTVMTAPVAQPASQPSNLVSLGSRLLKRLKDGYTMPGWSLAAAPAALLVAVSAWLLVPNTSYGETLLAAQLQRAIETTNTGETPLLLFRPVLTFEDKQQMFCRQFEVKSQSERFGAYACRGTNGTWDVVMQTPPTQFGPSPAAQQDLNSAVTARRNGPPIDEAEVRRLTANGWSRH